LGGKTELFCIKYYKNIESQNYEDIDPSGKSILNSTSFYVSDKAKAHPMPKTNKHKALVEEIKGIHQELRNQRAINERLSQRIDNLEKALSRKEQPEENEQSSSSSSSINSVVTFTETEKEEALTTYNFQAFSTFHEEFKSTLHYSYFSRERLEQVSENYENFLTSGTKKVLDLAIRKNDKEIEESSQNSEEIEKRILLQKLEKEFEAHPDCYCEAWFDYINTLEEKYQAEHLFSRGIYEA